MEGPNGKRPLEGHAWRCENNIKVDMKVIEWLGQVLD